MTRLKQALTERGVFTDSKMKLLIFTEHKDTLDYLHDRIARLLGNDDHVVAIHGSGFGSAPQPGDHVVAANSAPCGACQKNVSAASTRSAAAALVTQP